MSAGCGEEAKGEEEKEGRVEEQPWKNESNDNTPPNLVCLLST